MGLRPKIEQWNGWYLIVDASFDTAPELERHKTFEAATYALRRYRYLAQCHGKEGFDSKDEAKSKGAKYRRDYGCRFRAYECPICYSWHLTTSPARTDVNV